MNRSRRRGFNCTTSGFRISGFNCHCHGDGAADGWDGWDVSASWAWLVEMTWAMGHCQGETPCKCFTSELSWIILSYLELSWNDEPNIPNQTIKQNRLWCRNLFAIYLRATSCLQSMEELHRPRHVQVGLGWSSGAAREPNNGNWPLLGTRLPFISPPNWRCFVAGCCNQLPSYERCSQLPILDVDWIYTVDVDICWWSFWIVLLHTIFHRDQQVTGALPKMAISCTTPTDLLYLLDSNIM